MADEKAAMAGEAPPPPYPGQAPPPGPGYAPPPGAGYAPPPGQGYAPPPGEGYAPPPGAGYAPPPGAPPPGQGYAPPPGGYAPPPGPGYAPPPGPGYAPPPTAVYTVQPGVPPGTTHTTVVVTSTGLNPFPTQCPNCNEPVTTNVDRSPGILAWLSCIGLVCVGLWAGCCLIPFCIDSCYDVTHRCPKCRHIIGEYRQC